MLGSLYLLGAAMSVYQAEQRNELEKLRKEVEDLRKEKEKKDKEEVLK